MELIPFYSTTYESLNRSFLYGDGLLETIRVINGKAQFLVDHFYRLQNGGEILKYDLGILHSFESFQNTIQQFLLANKNPLSARIRITIFRKIGGFYCPSTNETDFVITGELLKDEKYSINSMPIKFNIHKELVKDYSVLSSVKTTSALLYVLAGQWAKESGYDECVLLNSNGNVVEGYKSNIFIVKNNELTTPSISEGCLDGVIRKQVINLCKENNIQIKQTSITISDLNNADEVLFTNVVSGITTNNIQNSAIAENLISLLNKSLS